MSPESIYKTFGTKAALAKAVFDIVIAGDDEPMPVAKRPEADAIRAESDVRRKIDMYAHGLARRVQRSAWVQILVRDGRHVHDELVPVWNQLLAEALTGMTGLGKHLLDTGQLRPGIRVNEVRDVLWNYIAVDHYERLVLARGWSRERYADWLSRAIAAAICP